MAKAPYPDYPPSYRLVDKLGGMIRQCWVLEVCTDDSLDRFRMAQFEDAIAILIDSKFPEIKANKIVRSDQFDTDLRRAMRTS